MKNLKPQVIRTILLKIYLKQAISPAPLKFFIRSIKLDYKPDNNSKWSLSNYNIIQRNSSVISYVLIIWVKGTPETYLS